jgi:GNAT superfamily N-acetyltransferase
MKLEIKEVLSAADRKTFIYLPEAIHQGHHQWVHPLFYDEEVFFNPKKNKSFAQAQTVLALAWEGTTAVGRIMGIINPKYNANKGEKNARFCFLESRNDIEITGQLIDFVIQWAKSHGMTKLVGPLAFSDKEPQGMLIEGFEEEVVIATNYNYDWMPAMLGQLGFEKEVDLVSYKIKVPESMPEFLQNVMERIQRNENIKLLEFKKRSQLKSWVVPLFRLVNNAYHNIYGFIPLTEKEMHTYAKRYLPILDPRFVKVAINSKDEVIAFVISMPEISPGIRKAKGRLLPLGWWHILRQSRKSRLLTLLLGAVDQEYRNIGLSSLLGIHVLDTAIKNNFELIDSHLILETNHLMRAECERYGGTLHKRYRIFSKNI